MRQLKITPSVTARDRTVNQYLSDINRLPMVTPEEETELAARIRAGDEAALRRLVEANLRFVVSVAKQYQNRGLDLMDLVDEGNIGLMKAAVRFGRAGGFKVISDAVGWSRHQILEALPDQGRAVRLPLNQVALLNRVSRARAEFLQTNEREPSDEELAALVDVTPEKLSEATLGDIRTLSLDLPLSDDGNDTLMDVLPDTLAPAADGAVEKESLRDDIATAMEILDERERRVVSLSFGLGCQAMTLEEIGENLRLTRERVRQVRMRAIRKLSCPVVRARLAQYL